MSFISPFIIKLIFKVKMSSINNMLVSLILLVYVIVSNSLRKTKIGIYNEASLATLFGIGIGILALFKGEIHQENTFFFELILPIIIMGAAQEVDLKLFQENFSFILWYGIVGTLLNFIGLFCFIFLFFEFFKLELL